MDIHHHVAVPRVAMVGRLIATPLTTTRRRTETVVSAVPGDLIQDPNHHTMVDHHDQVPLIETQIPKILAVLHHLDPVVLDRDLSSSSSPTRRIILSSRPTSSIPNGRPICALPSMHTDFKWYMTWTIVPQHQLTIIHGDRFSAGCT